MTPPQKKTLRKKNALPGLRSAAVNKLGFVLDREMRTPPQAQQQGSQSHNDSATNKQIATKCHDPKGDDDELKKTKNKKWQNKTKNQNNHVCSLISLT